MKEYKMSSSKGNELYNKVRNNEGWNLSQIYGSYSAEKARAFDRCEKMFLESENSYNFRIISHNTFQFSVAWNDYIGDEEILRIETANNSYLVWLDR